MPKLYSVRMRASAGERHISGAEVLVPLGRVETEAAQLLTRAYTHPRGLPSEVHVTVQAVTEEVQYKPLLPVLQPGLASTAQAQAMALETLTQAGVSAEAARRALGLLLDLPDSLRGAMVCSAQTGERLDDLGARGVRVSRMAAKSPEDYAAWLHAQGLTGDHVREALLLASKVVAAPGCVAELCWSDDPDYHTGYVATKAAYTRLPQLKPLGCASGGRVFFVQEGAALAEAIAFWQGAPTLLQRP